MKRMIFVARSPLADTQLSPKPPDSAGAFELSTSSPFKHSWNRNTPPTTLLAGTETVGPTGRQARLKPQPQHAHAISLHHSQTPTRDHAPYLNVFAIMRCRIPASSNTSPYVA